MFISSNLWLHFCNCYDLGEDDEFLMDWSANTRNQYWSYFLVLYRTELERKKAIVLWSSSDLSCFAKRDSVYVRVFGKRELDFFFWGGLLLRPNLFRVGLCSWLRSRVHHRPLAGKHKWSIMYAGTSCWTVTGVQKERVLSKQPLRCWRADGVKDLHSTGRTLSQCKSCLTFTLEALWWLCHLAVTRVVPCNQKEPSWQENRNVRSVFTAEVGPPRLVGNYRTLELSWRDV